jgi:aminoglycoside phosphotransferase (APT) family kinase protein
VLDWEMATVGDPLMDLGTALGYWIQADDPPVFQVAVFGPTHRPGNLTRVELVERWSRATGRDAGNVLFYFAFALFKLAVVAQQLYKRWVDGHTKEERYAAMLEGVRAVASSALVAIDKGRIDQLGD